MLVGGLWDHLDITWSLVGVRLIIPDAAMLAHAALGRSPGAPPEHGCGQKR